MEEFELICQESLIKIDARQAHVFPNLEECIPWIESEYNIDLAEVDINNWSEKLATVNSGKHSIVSFQARLEEIFSITLGELTKAEAKLFRDHKSELPTKPTKEDKLHFSINYLSILHERKEHYEYLLRMVAKKKEQYEDMHWGLQNLVKIWELRIKIQ